jgi:tRNA (pseudouridine54-N1)-methyltransferase
MKRRFVVVGRTATASPEFSLVDLAGSSGRLDVLLRCLRAALLVSHGLRRDTDVYLVLLGRARAPSGSPDLALAPSGSLGVALAPRVVRVRGAEARFVRPEERALALLAQRALAEAPALSAPGDFVEVRAGVAVARGGVEAAIADLGGGARYALEEGAADLREAAIDPDDVTFFVGDHLGFDPETRAALAAAGATPLGVGPVSVHAEDAIAIACNELDRRAAGAGPTAPGRRL